MKRFHWLLGSLAIVALVGGTTFADAKKSPAWLINYQIELTGPQPTITFSQPARDDTLKYHGWVFFVNTNAEGTQYEKVIVKVKVGANEDTTVFGHDIQLGNKPGDFKAKMNQHKGLSEQVMLDFCWANSGVSIPHTRKAQDGPSVVVDGSDSGKKGPRPPRPAAAPHPKPKGK